ncbi:zinc finger A20 and AN1 domain-containing stress-associated protein 12-like [Beta vulgaris subsp. vulgaris]|uniref:zinc finger A20 and AN1 domain-containing stress-associated protein 12-like n=1 Tax=Beta vulgaris subsp. vulgaris TaxID=3555 RepID=UPI002036AD88|nr:zinc finger A20 and AN1 domain-containing stress-associated protein 12-like [Beta vulgaris subsp. vulgaris]XP_057250804.1 zinc finger A20 and AN1 domain-containing stress-associated protein 12-like [Beta vulgaris subsp. vulgaris]
MNNNVQDPSQLCANGCGFFANPSLRNLCSSCYRDFLNKTLLEIERKSSHNNKQQTIVHVDSTDKKDASTSTRTRCDACKKRVGLIGFKCRCGGVYCGLHRYANEHSCAVDNIHKALEREALSKQLNAAACKADKFSCRI